MTEGGDLSRWGGFEEKGPVLEDEEAEKQNNKKNKKKTKGQEFRCGESVGVGVVG